MITIYGFTAKGNCLVIEIEVALKCQDIEPPQPIETTVAQLFEAPVFEG